MGLTISLARFPLALGGTIIGQRLLWATAVFKLTLLHLGELSQNIDLTLNFLDQVVRWLGKTE